MNENPQGKTKYLRGGVVDLNAVREEVEEKRKGIASLDSGAELLLKILDSAGKQGALRDPDQRRISELRTKVLTLRKELDDAPYWSVESGGRCSHAVGEINSVVAPYLTYLPPAIRASVERATVPLLTYKRYEEEKKDNQEAEDRIRGIIARLINLEEELGDASPSGNFIASQRMRLQEFIERIKPVFWTKEERDRSKILIDRVATILTAHNTISLEEHDSIFGEAFEPPNQK
jgi:hypothetical protein